MLSDRIKKITLSPTMKIAARAIEMKHDHNDLISLNVGEPDLPTPANIKDAALRALNADLTKYTPNSGLTELKDVIVNYLNDHYHIKYNREQIIVSNGAKQCLYNVVMSLINKDDEVIIPGPYYPSYAEMVRLAAGRPIFLMAQEKNNFKIQPDELEKVISNKTRAMILCNPSNPTGVLYSQAELTALADIVKERDIFIISDEIYAKLIYDEVQFCSFAAIDQQFKKKVIIVSGVSKSYAMTGWRIGYAAAEQEIIAGANIMQSHSTSNACTLSQHAAIEALSGPQDSVNHMRDIYQERRDLIYSRVSGIPELSCKKPMGAFYLFPNISYYTHSGKTRMQLSDSVDLAEYLLEKTHVVVVPGSAFGSDDHIRISYSNSLENIEEGISRISKALSDLLP